MLLLLVALLLPVSCSSFWLSFIFCFIIIINAAEKIHTGTIDKLGQFELPSQADMGTYDPSMGRNVRGATAGSSISSSSSITGGEATRNSSPEAVV